jgi:hypothetical protein
MGVAVPSLIVRVAAAALAVVTVRETISLNRKLLLATGTLIMLTAPVPATFVCWARANW